MSVPSNPPAIVFSKLIGLGIFMVGLAGLIAAVAALLYVVSAASKPHAQAPPETKLGFEVVQLGEFRRDQFLVDHDSGGIWNRVCSGDVKDGECNGALVWEQMCVDGKSSAACLMAQRQ